MGLVAASLAIHVTLALSTNTRKLAQARHNKHIHTATRKPAYDRFARRRPTDSSETNPAAKPADTGQASPSSAHHCNLL